MMGSRKATRARKGAQFNWEDDVVVVYDLTVYETEDFELTGLLDAEGNPPVPLKGADRVLGERADQGR